MTGTIDQMASVSASDSEPGNSPRARTISVPHVRMRYSPSRVAITQGLTVARRPRWGRADGMSDVSRWWEGRSVPTCLGSNDCAARRRLDSGNVGANVAPVEPAVLEGAGAGPEVAAERVDEPDVRHAVRTGGAGRIRRAIRPHHHVPLEHAARCVLRQRSSADP